MANIKDTRTLCEILKEKPLVVPSVKLFKKSHGKDSECDNWIEATRFEYKKEKVKDDEESV
jgi:hypothetical protein